MDGLLKFFSDLILFTAGLGVSVIWLVILLAIAIEIYDTVTGKDKKTDEDEED